VNRSKSVRTTEFWRRRGKRKYNQGPKPGTWRIAYAVARAHRWFDEISTGKARSLAEIAACEGLAVRYVGRLIRLGLAPVIIESIVEGRQPISLTAEALTRHIELPLEWRSQKAALNIQ
jgi:site-specific DNA recombinase